METSSTQHPTGARPARDVASGASLTSNAQSAGQLETEDRSLSNVREGMRNERSATAVRRAMRTCMHAMCVLCGSRYVSARIRPFPIHRLMGSDSGEAHST